MTPGAPPLHLGVALDGAGWHPGAGLVPTVRPAEQLTGRYWSDLVGRAERGLLDLVTIADSFHPDAGERLDAVLIASRVAPTTRSIGLVPTATVTHTEPFHVSKAIATLDYVSTGRAGWLVDVSPTAAESALFGRREIGPADAEALWEEAADAVEAVRRLWDSWEDDAEIRDVASGRFVDREKLHYVDFSGRWFSVRGPSITPRPPQGQPIVAVQAGSEAALRFAASSADLVFVPAVGDQASAAAVSTLDGSARHVLADVVVLLDTDSEAARQRWSELERLAASSSAALRTEVFVGTPDDLADRLTARASATGLSGFRLHPATLPQDLDQIVESLVPALQRRGAFRTAYESGSLRGLLGLDRPTSRYATLP